MENKKFFVKCFLPAFYIVARCSGTSINNHINAETDPHKKAKTKQKQHTHTTEILSNQSALTILVDTRLRRDLLSIRAYTWYAKMAKKRVVLN